MENDDKQYAFSPILEKILDEKVVVLERGKRKTLTKLEIIMKQLGRRAAAGDRAARDLLVELFSFAAFPEGAINERETTWDEFNAKIRKIFNLPEPKVSVSSVECFAVPNRHFLSPVALPNPASLWAVRRRCTSFLWSGSEKTLTVMVMPSC